MRSTSTADGFLYEQAPYQLWRACKQAKGDGGNRCESVAFLVTAVDNLRKDCAAASPMVLSLGSWKAVDPKDDSKRECRAKRQ
jgi:hypothetical protein